MGKDWKKRVSDFFFYEEEVIEEVAIDEVKEINQETVNRQMLETNRAVNAKVTYQYPKDEETPFRFPVIPDIDAEELSVRKRRKQMKSVTNIEDDFKKDPLIYGYHHQKSVKKLDDVPAYMRRREIRQKQQKEEEVVETKETDHPLQNHTRPDELDRVFRKRDGLLEDGSKVHQDRKSKRTDRANAHSILQPNEIEQQFVQKPSNQETKAEQIVTLADATVEQEEFNNMSKNEEEPLVYHDRHTPISPVKDKQDLEPKISSQPIITEQVSNQVEHMEDLPSYLLNDPVIPTDDDTEWLREQQLLLEQTLKHFKIKASIVNVTQGPAVTRFEVQPALGVKVSRIRNLADDIKLNMSAKDIRIEAPIPGKNTIGIEVPNLYPQVVSLQEIIESEPFETESSPLTIALGLSIEGNPLITNIGKMPHGLIAGATGSGKSVCINTIILSVLYKAHYEDVKMLLIDPKMVELTPYNGIPHLISPVITDVKAATMALKWAVDEMEQRYEKFVEAGVRNITRYNEKIAKHNDKIEKMPYLVIIIDELADLMMVSPQDVEDAICRIAQKARACGIHLIVATQRPSVDVITGLIKANIPTRIAFSVSSQVDSRTIIDTNGAEKLLGKGDMLFVENGSNKSVRLQGPFVSDEEIDRVANHLRSIAEPSYLFEQEQLLIEVDAEEEDELINEVISFVLEQNQVSTSLLQRRFRIGYNRAARLIDTLENKGIISAQNGSKPREVLASKSQVNDIE